MPPSAPELRACVRCVMDTTDPDIVFDAAGVCNHCHTYDRKVRENVLTGAAAEAHLAKLVATIKAAGRKREYDCVIGVSGGVDSTYVAWKTKELGLRPLAVHLDNGWDSELAVKNIERVLKTLGIELYTHVIDWDEFKDLQLAFLKASTPDSEVPSDHAIISLMCQMARKVKVKYILSGVNQRTESHLPGAWSQGYLDWTYIQGLHKLFGTRPLTTYPHQTLFQLVRNRATLEWVDLLNYVDYSKAEAMKVLQGKLGWVYYGGKHYESIYTRFYQGYILPRKFGFDKRKSHLSSLVCSGEIAREAALEELKKEPYPADLQAEDRAYVIKKFGLTPEAFDALMSAPPKRFGDYPSSAKGRTFRTLRAVYRWLRRR